MTWFNARIFTTLFNNCVLAMKANNATNFKLPLWKRSTHFGFICNQVVVKVPRGHVILLILRLMMPWVLEQSQIWTKSWRVMLVATIKVVRTATWIGNHKFGWKFGVPKFVCNLAALSPARCKPKSLLMPIFKSRVRGNYHIVHTFNIRHVLQKMKPKQTYPTDLNSTGKHQFSHVPNPKCHCVQTWFIQHTCSNISLWPLVNFTTASFLTKPNCAEVFHSVSLRCVALFALMALYAS